MPSEDIDDVRSVKGMHRLARLCTSNVDAFITVLVEAMGAAYIGAVEAEGETVHPACHGGEGVFADPVGRVPEGDQGVAAADGYKVAVWTLLNAVGGAGVGVEGVEEGLWACQFDGGRKKGVVGLPCLASRGL